MLQFKKINGIICLAFTNVRVLATIMNNKSERDNQIENKEEDISCLNKSLILSMLKDLLFMVLKILTMVLFYRFLVYLFPYWKFIGIYGNPFFRPQGRKSGRSAPPLNTVQTADKRLYKN
jgi:hypothetical protein